MIFGWLANKFWFIQDDAYISYRYVANFLNGHGLVYNIGERIEGFTNFGWVIYLALIGAMKLDFILVSQLTGLAFGAGLIILTYLLARHLFAREDSLLACCRFIWLPSIRVWPTGHRPDWRQAASLLPLWPHCTAISSKAAGCCCGSW